jgi:hypothetical protein
VLVLASARYGARVSERPSDLIAATGVRPVVANTADVDIPSDVLADQDLSLMARGLYALLVAEQGKPVDPYDDAFESPEDLAAAIEELIAAGLAVRVTP